MKNFKKLFSIVAVVAMLATTIPTATLGAASYSDELEGAYDYAYGIGITTQSSIDTANMYGSLIRSHMAKMMVNYAKEVLGKTPDTSKTCEFTDVANQTDELQGYITEACQLGLMGVGITAFNPNGVVTRAQFGTVLSRALYGDIYNDGDPYYADHLAALQDAGIMNNISNPNATEVRGYVMLMMQRADEGASTPEVCQTPENILSCSLGLDTCPSVCQVAQEAKSGTLTVSAVGADYTSIPNTGAVKFATVTFKAGAEDINVYGVTFKKDALSSIPSASRLYFEKDGARVSGKASFSENKATVSFSTALSVKAGASEKVDLYMLLSASYIGNEYQFSSTYIDSSAEAIDGTIVTPLMKTLSYNIAALTMANGGSDISYKVDDSQLVELGQFTMGTITNNTDKDLNFKAITISQSGNASLSYLSDLGLYRDEVKVSTKATVDGRNISFVLDDQIKYVGPSTISYVIKGKITNADRVGDYYQFAVKYPENTLVEEDGTNFKATINNGTTALNLSTITINGADLKFTQPAMSYTKDVVPGTLAVKFYEGTVSSLVSVTLQNPSLTFSSTLSGVDTLKTIYFKIGNTVLSATPTTTGAGTVTFDGTVTINGTLPVLVYADIKDTAGAGSVKFSNTISLSSFGGPNEYNSNGQTISSSIGSLSPITNTIVAAGLQMTNTYSNAQTVQKGDRDLKLADLKFSTTTDVISKISSFRADLSGSTWTNFQGGTVTVYDEDGAALASKSIVSGTSYLTFVLPSVVNVSKTTPAIFTIKLDQVANTTASPNTLKLLFATGTVVAKNYITNNSIYPSAAAVSSVLTVTDAGTVTTVAQSFNPKLQQLDGSTVALGSLKFTPFNGNATIKNVYLTLSGYSATEMPYTEVILKDGETNVATFMNDGNNTLFATNINKTLTVGATKTYNIVATLKNATTSGNLGSTFKFLFASGTFESMNGIAMGTSPIATIVSPVIELVKAKPTVAYVSSQKGGNAVYKFRITANGGDMKVNEVLIAAGVTTDMNNATATLYLGNEGGTTLGTGTVTSGGSQTLTFSNLSGLVNITNGSSQDFTLSFPVNTWYRGTNPGNIGIEVSNLTYYDVFADSTEAVHTNIFTSYKWDIAPVTTLITLE